MLVNCILKGKTTSELQYEEFLNSYIDAVESRYDHLHENRCVQSVFMLDTDTSIELTQRYMEDLKETWDTDYVILKRDDDPGELRNEFMTRLVIEFTEDEARRNDLVFMFFDGDDRLDDHTLVFKDYEVKGRGFALMNPVAFYGDAQSDFYPLKWCQRAVHDDIFRSALLDRIGGQCWGKVWDFPIAKQCMFGNGLFEDVPFWYQVTELYRNPVLMWDKVYYWRRNNPNALTRNNPSVASIRNGIDNLNYALEVALRHYNIDDVEAWRRYTVGTIVLIRNAAKAEGSKDLLEYIKKNIDWAVFKPTMIKETDPKFWNTLITAFPKFIEWLDE